METSQCFLPPPIPPASPAVTGSRTGDSHLPPSALWERSTELEMATWGGRNMAGVVWKVAGGVCGEEGASAGAGKAGNCPWGVVASSQQFQHHLWTGDVMIHSDQGVKREGLCCECVMEAPVGNTDGRCCRRQRSAVLAAASGFHWWVPPQMGLSSVEPGAASWERWVSSP